VRLPDRHFLPVTRDRLVGCILAPLAAGGDFAAFLDDPDRFMERGLVLKDDASSRVVRVALDGTDVVIKRDRYPDPLRALRRCLRASRAARAWRGGLLLEQSGFVVAAPLGWVERRRGSLRIESWGLAGHVGGHDAAFLPDAALSSAEQGRWVAALAGVVRRLRGAGLVHGDLKASNLLLTAAGEVCLLDLHAIRRPAAWRRTHALDRERARFLANWQQHPELVAAFAAALDDETIGHDRSIL